MAYLALYRKYRSQDFATVVGQKHVIQTLKNAISQNRLAHAYLFSGPRGTGKTSLARILAKSLNCREGISEKPCQVCPVCESITSGNSVDVVEIDAASNRGINEIRALREQVNFVPVDGRYKVYIIDEAHMLTTEAFNALLKTLEEPPSHTLFILATTEIQKIPATILSRCQRLDFKRIVTSEIIGHLKYIAGQEKVTVDERSLQYIARTADGCMRDAISLLDQLISFRGEKIIFDDVLTLLGSSEVHTLADFIDQLFGANAETILQRLEGLLAEGKNLQQLNKDLLEYLRDLLLVKAGAFNAVEAGTDFLARLQKQADGLNFEELRRMIMVLSRSESDMRWQANSRLIFELALLEIALRKDAPAAIVAPVAAPVVAAVKAPVAASVKPVVSFREKVQEIKKHVDTVAPTTVVAKVQPEAPKPKAQLTMAEIKHSWHNFINRITLDKPALKILICESTLQSFANNEIVLVFKESFSFHRDKLMQASNKDHLEKVLLEIYGQPLKVNAIVEKLTVLDIPDDGEELPTASTKPKQDRQTEQILNIFSGKVIQHK